MGLALTFSKRVRTLDKGSMQCIDHKLNTTLQISSEANEILNEAFTSLRNLARSVHQSGHYNRVGRGMSIAQKKVFEAPSNLPNKVKLPSQNYYCFTENERTFALS